MVLPPFNSTWSNTSAIWEFWPAWLGRICIRELKKYDRRLGRSYVHRTQWICVDCRGNELGVNLFTKSLRAFAGSIHQ
jgi:hypothetical protein